MSGSHAVVSLQKTTNVGGLTATKLSWGHVEVKAADSLMIFPLMMREARSIQAKCSTGVKNSSSKRSNYKIQKLRSDGKQLTESQNKRIQRISKVPHSSGRWTKFGAGNFDSFHSERLCSAENVWRQTRYYLYLQEYISTLNWLSDTAEALSVTKRVYASLPS